MICTLANISTFLSGSIPGTISDMLSGALYLAYFLASCILNWDILSGMVAVILSDILSGICSNFLSELSGTHSVMQLQLGLKFDSVCVCRILSGAPCGTLTGTYSDILSDIVTVPSGSTISGIVWP